MKKLDIFNYLNKIYPFEDQEIWDKSGLFYLNKENDYLRNVLISLDINEKVILKAKELDVNLIICHHPLFIDDDKLENDNNLNKSINLLKTNNISYISCHTNFDKNNLGMNYFLCKKMNLKNIKKISNNDYVYYGDINKKLSTKELIIFLKKIFNLDSFSISTNYVNKKYIKKIAICGGSGSNFIDDLTKNLKIDVYITSEVKWNYWCNLRDDLILCELPHFIESIFVDVIYKKIDSFILKENIFLFKYDLETNFKIV